MNFKVTNPKLIKYANFRNTVDFWDQATAQKPGILPASMTGPGPGMIGKAIAGAGLGYLASYPLSWMSKNLDRTRMKRVLPMVGAGAMALSSLPAVTNAPPGQLTGGFPFNKPASDESDDGTHSTIDAILTDLEKAADDIFGEQPEWQSGQLGPPNSPTMYGGVSPYTPGMGVTGDREFALGQAMNTVLSDTGLNTTQRAVAIKALRDAAQQSRSQGIITLGDLTKGAIGAGVGYGAASLFSKALGAVFGLPAQTQRRLSQIGAVGGLMNAIGVLSY